jgi:hypothetical protein
MCGGKTDEGGEAGRVRDTYSAMSHGRRRGGCLGGMDDGLGETRKAADVVSSALGNQRDAQGEGVR